jgi:hypothetical protein
MSSNKWNMYGPHAGLVLTIALEFLAEYRI